MTLVPHFRIFVVIVGEENPNSADCMLKNYLVHLVDESRNNRSHQDIILVLEHTLVVGNYHISSLKYLLDAVVPKSLLAVKTIISALSSPK